MGLVNIYHGYDRENLLVKVISISNLYATDTLIRDSKKISKQVETFGMIFQD